MIELQASGEAQQVDRDVDQLDAGEGDDDAADAVDDQVAAKDVGRAHGSEFYAAQGEGDEQDDDDGVEDDGAENGAVGRLEPHDIERGDGGEGGHEHGGDDCEVFRDIVGD